MLSLVRDKCACTQSMLPSIKYIYIGLNIKKKTPSIVVTFVSLAKIRCRVLGGGSVVVAFYSNRILSSSTRHPF